MTETWELALISLAVEPKTPADAEKLARGLETMAAEQPRWFVHRDGGNGRVVIEAAADQQLEVIVDRLKREFHVEASVGRPQVIYREAVTQPADGEMR